MYSNPDGEFRRIDDAFEAAKVSHAAAIREATVERESVIAADWRWQAFVVCRALAWLGVAGGAIFAVAIFEGIGLILAPVGVYIFATHIRRWRSTVTGAAARGCAARLSAIALREAGAREAVFAAEREYDIACIGYHSYPPDWAVRRALVFKRDDHQCTACGWPKGYRRRTRELHVHHVIALANGGNNALTNLVTLCHLCHRSVDWNHRHVQNSRRRKRR